MVKDGLTLTGGHIVAGVWEGTVSGTAATTPTFDVTHMGQPVDGLQVSAKATGEWVLRVPIPVEVLDEGVQTFLVRAGPETLGHFTVIAGSVLEDDLRAEIDLMRAELDVLKRAFRRHFS